jgi:ribosome-associated protein
LSCCGICPAPSPSPTTNASGSEQSWRLGSTRTEWFELLWDLTRSTAVTEVERARLLEKLAARLDAEGMVRVVASDRRSQSQNREAAAERLAKIVRQALVVPRKRRPTKPTAASREQRLNEKKRRGERKRDRRRNFDD